MIAEPPDDIPLGERIANVEVAIAFLLGVAAEHRARAEEAERAIRELTIGLVEMQAELVWRDGRIH